MKNKKLICTRKDKQIYLCDDKVVKVFDYEYNTAMVLNEALNHARIEETELNVPSLLEVSKREGKWAITLSYVKGKTLAQLMEENPEQTDKYLNQFVDIQLWIHKQSSPLLTKQKDKMSRKIDLTDLDSATKYELHTRLEALPRHRKVCHGDFNPSNVIIDNDGTPYIIDWSHATQGNASMDVARTYLLFYLDNKQDLAEKYLDLFCSKTNTDKRYVQKCIPIVAATQLVKGNKEEREFLLKWINVVDYE